MFGLEKHSLFQLRFEEVPIHKLSLSSLVTDSRMMKAMLSLSRAVGVDAKIQNFGEILVF